MARKKIALRTVVVASTKGGVGKTTLSATLAIRAAGDGDRVALIDADQQSSLQDWCDRRRQSMGPQTNPLFFDVDCSQEAIGLIEADGFDWLFIDTPPQNMHLIIDAVARADFVVVPVRPSAIDLESIGHIHEIVTDRMPRPFAFVLNQINPTAKLTTESSVRFLRELGPVLTSTVAMRAAYLNSATTGQTGPEKDRSGVCKAEIDALWAELKKSIDRKAGAQ